MISSYRRFSKFVLLLGLLAILMATLAPTVSQVLAAQRGADFADAAVCSAGRHMTPADKSHVPLSDMQACGYCGLLAHLPVMPTALVPFTVIARAIHHQAATRFASVLRVEPLTFARPRAPPFVA